MGRCFHHFKSLAVILASGLFLSACDTLEITRTANDPFTMRGTVTVPVYKSVCTQHPVYGQAPECGVQQTCSIEHVCTGHHNSNCHDENVCHDIMNSCYHFVTNCSDELSHNTDITVIGHFDSKAVLSGNEADHIKITMTGDHFSRTLSFDITSPRYKYDYPHEVTLDLTNTSVTATLDIKVIGYKK